MERLTSGSVCSGIGGLDLAAALAGFDIRFHIEVDEWRRKVLAKHAAKYWPNAVTFSDIQTVAIEELPKVDVLFGGFPCQDVSLAGRRAGVEEGTRSGLWFHFRRLIGGLRPRAVVVENVPGLLTLGGSAVVADLARMGYVGRAGVISANDATSPQLRERVFIVAYARQDGRVRGRIVPNGAESAAGREASQWAQHSVTSQGHCKNRLGRSRRHDARKSQSRLGRTAHGLPARLDGFVGFPAPPGKYQHPYEPTRTSVGRSPFRENRTEALGDVVVPWQAYPIFYYLYEVLS